MVLNNSLFRKIAGISGKGAMYHDHSSHFSPPTMDEMPKPVKSWAELNAARQAKYNKHLVLGVGFFLVTLGVMQASGLLYLNYYPPARPAPKN